MSLVAAILFATAVFSCDVPKGYTERQRVKVFVYQDGKRSHVSSNCIVYQSTTACDSYCICVQDRIFYVSKSNKEGYKYMFWYDDGWVGYFNM